MYATTTAPAVAPHTGAARSQTPPRQQHLPAWALWRTTELSTLRALYPSGGSQAVHEALPHRSLGSIRAKASTLKLKCHKSSTEGKRFARKYQPSDYVDQRIRDGYAAARAKGDYARLADELNRPRWWVQKRATALGLTRTVNARLDAWSAEELALLDQWGTCTLPVIRRKLAAAGHTRTETAIAVKLRRLHIDRTDPDRWSAGDVARALGVDPATVRDWIARRGLPALQVGAGDVPRYAIERKALRGWIKTHPRYIDLRRVDQTWFLDLVFGSAQTL